jgi:hypothetical protein
MLLLVPFLITLLILIICKTIYDNLVSPWKNAPPGKFLL